MKKFARTLALALCLLSLASCAQTPQPDPVPPPPEDASFNPDSEGLIRLTGQNARLRELYPNAVIIGTVGMMNDTAYPAIEQAVKNRAAAGDSKVFSFKLEWAGSTHPILSKHKKAGEDLAAFLAEKLGW